MNDMSDPSNPSETPNSQWLGFLDTAAASEEQLSRLHR